MQHGSIESHLADIRKGFESARAEAPPHADASWFAYRGYQSSGHSSGAGHLAWERIAGRLAQARERALTNRRAFDDKRVAFAMGYGLGLRDHGRLTIARSEHIVEAIMPVGPRPVPCYRTGRFWFLVTLLVATEATALLALEQQHPSYPELSAPMVHASPRHGVADTASGDSNDETLRARALSDGVVAGSIRLADALTTMGDMPYPQLQAVVVHLLAALPADDRLQLVDGLSALPVANSTPLLLRVLRDPCPKVVSAALATLVARGERAVLNELPPLLTHEKPDVRRVAVEAAGVIGTPVTAWRIVGLLDDEDPELRRSARRALIEIVGRDYGPRPSGWYRHLPANRS